MRTVIGISYQTPTSEAMTTFSPQMSTSLPQQRSPWHSPVPYLFGGLAAMLGLIAFALLILACSYWRLSGRLDGNNGDGRRRGDVENGETKQVDSDGMEIHKVFEEKFLVIMAGEANPTFLATPSSRASSFNDKSVNLENSDDGNREKIVVKEDDNRISVSDHESQQDHEQNHEPAQ